MPLEPLWKTLAGFELHTRAWDGECVVYNCGSGDTHLLDEVGAEMLRALARAPLTLTALTQTVSSSLEFTSEREFAMTVERLVMNLHKLGLIESIPGEGR